jgi:DNA topoisomerase-1
MVFHEITRDAIERALLETRDIDARLVDAQETRRILDRLYGYEVSPVLWKKIMPRLSAGRVQSVATRLVVERERARRAFVAAEYWDIEGTFAPGPFTARLVSVDGKRVAQAATSALRDALGDGASSGSTSRRPARRSPAALEGADVRVRSVEQKPYTRRPAAPFMTSTLQQEASRKLRLGRRRRCASRSACTRTATSPTCGPTRRRSPSRRSRRARDQARELYGAQYVPDQPRRYDRKVKNAQEAHEGDRPPAIVPDTADK